MAEKMRRPLHTFNDGTGSHIKWDVYPGLGREDDILAMRVMQDQYGGIPAASAVVFLTREALVDLIADLTRALR